MHHSYDWLILSAVVAYLNGPGQTDTMTFTQRKTELCVLHLGNLIIDSVSQSLPAQQLTNERDF